MCTQMLQFNCLKPTEDRGLCTNCSACSAVCFLARECTRWTRHCDRALHRIMCYIHSTYELRLEGWVGDGATALSLHAYADADFAGCPKTKRSTSGGVALY